MTDMIKVKNRGASVVVYRIPETGIRRSFAPGETKAVSAKELEQLTYQPGGMEILTRFLQIQDSTVLNNFNMKVEPEYHMSEADVAKLITNGSLDAFLDALDFAPISVIDLIKKLAISIPMVDIQKRKALKEKTGFDVTKALIHDEESKAPETEEEKVAAAAKAAAPAGRRTAANYKPATPAPAQTPVKTEAKS